MENKDKLAIANLTYDKLGLGALVYAYAMLVGAAYLLAFWRPFGFEVFTYLSLKDYVTAPLSRMSMLLIYPLLIAAILLNPSKLFIRPQAAISLYVIGSTYFSMVIHETYVSWRLYQERASYPDSEQTIFFFIGVLLIGSIVLAFRSNKPLHRLPILLLSIFLVQLALSLAAGYRDGKTISSGLKDTRYLQNDGLCGTSENQKWIYIAHYSNRYFFLSSFDNRICILENEVILMQTKLNPKSPQG